MRLKTSIVKELDFTGEFGVVLLYRDTGTHRAFDLTWYSVKQLYWNGFFSPHTSPIIVYWTFAISTKGSGRGYISSLVNSDT